MALVKCKECGKEISSTVKVCPSCGYKKKPSKLTYFIVIILGAACKFHHHKLVNL